MNDLELVRDLRAEVPVPPASRLASGRARLTASVVTGPVVTGPVVAGKRPAFSVRLLAAAAAAVVIAGAVGYGVTSRGSVKHPPAAVKKPPKSVTQATLAAEILRTASAVVERAPVTTVPSPGQWIYKKTVDFQYPNDTTTDEEWITFDGDQSAYYQSGQLVVHQSPGGVSTPSGKPLAAFNTRATPETAYDALASLPSDPNDLLAAADSGAVADGGANGMAGGVISYPPTTKAQLEFDYLALILWNAAAGVGGPPKAEAAVLRAMAALPGITVEQHVTDAAGADAIAVSDDRYDQLLLDSHTYQVLGLRQLSNGLGPVKIAQLPTSLRKQFEALLTAQQRSAWWKAHAPLIREIQERSGQPAGTVEQSLAFVRISEVAAPGDH